MWVAHLGSMWQAWVCAQGDWEGSVREGGGEQGLLRSRLELAHCYLCPILLAKACPKLASLDSRVGSWACWGGPATSHCKGHGYRENGPLGPYVPTVYYNWCAMISYRKIGYIKQKMDSPSLKMINAVMTQVVVSAKGGDMQGLLGRPMRWLGGGWGCSAHGDAGCSAHAPWPYVQRHRWCQLQE